VSPTFRKDRQRLPEVLQLLSCGLAPTSVDLSAFFPVTPSPARFPGLPGFGTPARSTQRPLRLTQTAQHGADGCSACGLPATAPTPAGSAAASELYSIPLLLPTRRRTQPMFVQRGGPPLPGRASRVIWQAACAVVLQRPLAARRTGYTSPMLFSVTASPAVPVLPPSIWSASPARSPSSAAASRPDRA